jgi:hypothetical protein
MMMPWPGLVWANQDLSAVGFFRAGNGDVDITFQYGMIDHL